MSFLPTQTLDAIKRRARAHFRTAFNGLPMGVRQFLGQTALAIALNIWGLQKSVEDIENDIVPSPHSSTNALQAWAVDLGLPDGAGGYGALLPTPATGGTASLTGALGTVYPNNATATAEDGITQIKLSGSVTIAGTPPGLGSITGEFIAVTTGTVGNLAAGTVCTWDSPPAGADPSFTLILPLEGGEDTETNPHLYGRIVTRLQNPPRGGVAEDYVLWAEEEAGISEVYVYPRRHGTGSVDVVIMQAGTGSGRIPSAAQLLAVQGFLDTEAPVAVEDAEAMLPVASTARAVKVQVVPNGPDYAFDWDDGPSGSVVDTAGYAAGPPATITLTALAPASLKDAVDAYIAGVGVAPGLQVASTGAVTNPVVRVVSYVDGGGKTTLTLDTLPTDWVAPVATNKVYAHGPVVDIIAAGIVALVDALGPSRLSGFADPFHRWNDILAVNQIARVAEDAVDTDGTALIQLVPPGLATIDGAATDIQAADPYVTAPEFIRLSSVVVVAAPAGSI